MGHRVAFFHVEFGGYTQRLTRWPHTHQRGSPLTTGPGLHLGYTTPRNVTRSASCYRPAILDLRVEWVMSGHVCLTRHRRGIRKGSAREVNIYNRAPGAAAAPEP